jgi:choloylglycine hydrolase
MKRNAVGALVVVLALVPGPALPCTTFCMRSGAEILVGKNYDWDIGDGHVIVNKRGVAKTSMAGQDPARWVSRYGSVTFNQYGRDLPSGGMNEAGLVVELMWLEATRYPTTRGLPVLGCLEWIQYQLDTAATIADLRRGAGAVRIESDAKLHYLACDRSGECASVEFLDGRLVLHSGAEMPIPALTNDTYEDSARFASRHAGFGGTQPTPAGPGSLERFVRAATLARAFTPTSSDADVGRAFGILDAVAQGSYTRWNIVHDVAGREVSFRTRENRDVGRLRLGVLDFRCSTPVLVHDLGDPRRGDVAGALSDYTREANRSLVFRSYRGTPFLAGISDAALERIALHPETTRCTQPGR